MMAMPRLQAPRPRARHGAGTAIAVSCSAPGGPPAGGGCPRLGGGADEPAGGGRRALPHCWASASAPVTAGTPTLPQRDARACPSFRPSPRAICSVLALYGAFGNALVRAGHLPFASCSARRGLARTPCRILRWSVPFGTCSSASRANLALRSRPSFFSPRRVRWCPSATGAAWCRSRETDVSYSSWRIYATIMRCCP